ISDTSLPQQLQSCWAFLFLPFHYQSSLHHFYSFFAPLLPKLHFPPLPSLKFPFSHHFSSQKCHFLCTTSNLTSMRCDTSSHMIELIQFIKELQSTWNSHLNNFLKRTNVEFIFIFIGLVFRQICMMSFKRRELLRCGRHIRRWMLLRGIRERS